MNGVTARSWLRGLGLSVAALACVATSGAGCSGCTDDGPAGGNNTETSIRENNPTVMVPEGAVLQHVPPECDAANPVCAGDLTFSSGRVLNVKLIDPQGVSVPEASITYELDAADAMGTTLAAANAITDGQGLAKVDLRSGTTQGVASVTVSVADDQNVSPIRFLISVNPKGSASYEVDFTHTTATELQDIKVRLFSAETTCEQVIADELAIRDGDPGTNPTLTAAYQGDGQADAAGLPIVIFPGLKNGDAYTVAAQAFARSNDAVEMAFGCKDGNPAINNGQSVRVTVDLRDHFPHLVGTYDVTHSFNLVSGLPPTVQTVIRIIGRVANDPGSFIVGCDERDDTCTGCNKDLMNPAEYMACQDTTSGGFLDLLLGFDFLPQSWKDTIKNVVDTPLIRGVARNVINDFVGDFVTNSLPPWAGSTITIAQDITQTLSDLKVTGVIRIKEPPMVVNDENGSSVAVLPNDSAEQVWTDIVVYWKQGCDANAPPTCGARSLLSQLPQDQASVRGDFDGSIEVTADGYLLTVNQHSLTLNYGVLVLGVIEKIVLPAAFGQNVDSIDKLLALAITGDANGSICGTLIGALIEENSAVGSVAVQFCEDGLSDGLGYLRDLVTENLVVEGSDAFLIGSPEGKPCTLFIPDLSTIQGDEWPGKPLPYIENIGKENPSNLQCVWEVDIKFSDSNTTRMNGRFWGGRKQ